MAKKYGPFESYPLEEGIKIVTELMQAGESNSSVARILKTSRGAIAGFRRRHGIPSKHPPPDMRKKVMSAAPASKVPIKLAVHEREQCIADVKIGTKLYRCGGLREPGSPFCKTHQPTEFE